MATTTLLAVLGAIAYLAVRSTSYEATADVLVAPLSSTDSTYGGIPLIRESSDGSRPIQTAAGLLAGTPIARLAALRLGGSWTASKIEGDVAVVPSGESNLVSISATSDEAAEAANVANAYTAAALEHRRRALQPFVEREISILAGDSGNTEELKQLEAVEENGDPTLSLATKADPPTSEAGPSGKLVLVIALVLGLLVGFGTLLVVNVARTSPPTPRT